jgi:hypothetical protein
LSASAVTMVPFSVSSFNNFGTAVISLDLASVARHLVLQLRRWALLRLQPWDGNQDDNSKKSGARESGRHSRPLV